MFKFKNRTMKHERITVVIRDQLGSPYAIVGLSKSSIVECTYVTTTGILQLVLSSTKAQGVDEIKSYEITKPTKQNGRIIDQPTGSFKQDKFYFYQMEHNLLNISDEDDIRRIWTWMDMDISVEKLFEYRKEQQETLEKFKQQKLKEEDDKKLAADADKVNGTDPGYDAETIKLMKAGKIGTAAGTSGTKPEPQPIKPAPVVSMQLDQPMQEERQPEPNEQ
jgi:hypothetical protein